MLPWGVDHAVDSVGRSVGSNVEKVVAVAVIEIGVVEVDVDEVLVGGSSSSMVVVRVVIKTQDPDPKVVLADAVTEHPDSTTLLVVVHEDDPGAVVVHDTKKSVTVAVEQDEVVVLVVSESVTAHPTMLVHVEATLVVEGPTDDVVAHSVADSVSHSSGLDEYVGLWSGPTLCRFVSVYLSLHFPRLCIAYVMGGHGGRGPWMLIPDGRLMTPGGGGPLEFY